MLLRLEIHDLAIVESLSFRPSDGLNVLTGETGAGKSVIARALGLLLGERASVAVVRSGCEAAHVLGEWELDGERFVIERSVPGRATLNGEKVPLSTLQKLAPRLMARTGQHDQRLLLDEGEHRHLLDRFARLDLGPMQRAHSDWIEARQRLAELRMSLSRRDERMELLRFQLAELVELAPTPDEATALDADLNALRHAEELRAGLREIDQQLYASEGAVVECLGRAASSLRRLAALDPRLEPHATELNEILTRVDDLAHGLRQASPDSDPERLHAGELRLSALREAHKKHKSDDLVALLEAIGDELADLERLDGDSRDAELAVDACLERANAAAERLRTQRTRAAKSLDAALAGVLSRLGMERAKTRTRLRPGELGPQGFDEVVFELSANPGEEPRALAKVASGGELSRVLFALRMLLSPEVDCWLFDEIDAGIGGSVAEALATELRALGTTAQVLCISHLPTIAGAADHHFSVAKAVLRGRTRATLRRLEGEDRIDEVARMIGGPREGARACARQLLIAWRAQAERVA